MENKKIKLNKELAIIARDAKLAYEIKNREYMMTGKGLNEVMKLKQIKEKAEREFRKDTKKNIYGQIEKDLKAKYGKK